MTIYDTWHEHWVYEQITLYDPPTPEGHRPRINAGVVHEPNYGHDHLAGNIRHTHR